MTTYVLLPSPLVGPATWEPVATRLQDADSDAVVADPGPSAHPEEVLAAFAASAGSVDGDVVLVPHSNAGYYAPLLADAVDAAATVYVDAALPASTGPTHLAPPELASLLADLADDDGLLPRWSEWWGDAEALFPDAITRRQVEAAMPRLPLSYFRASLEAPIGWERRPSAFLAFGDAYADELARAEALRWPTRRLDAPHLFPLWDANATAANIIALCRTIGLG